MASSDWTNTKKLLYQALQQTGDRPQDVQCQYFLGSDVPTGQIVAGGSEFQETCPADQLPERDVQTLTCFSERYEYDLIRTGEGAEIKIKERYHERKRPVG